MKLFSYIIVTLYLLFRTTYLYAGILSTPGTAGAHFLKINLSARAQSLSQSYCGLADDVAAVYYNPAGLAQIERTELQFNNLMWYEDVTANNISFAQSISSINTIAFDARILQGEDYVRELQNNEIVEKEKISLIDSAISVSYAHKFAAGRFREDDLYIGITLKHIDEQIYTQQNNTQAMDVGFLYNSHKTNSLYGISVQNIGPKLGEDILPTILRLGAGYKTEEYSITWELDQGIDSKVRIGCGIELKSTKILIFRMGSSFQEEKFSYTLGLGINIKSVQIDYAYISHPDSSLSQLGFVPQMVSVILSF